MSNYFTSNSRRRRRALTPVTCSDIKKLGTAVVSLTVEQLKTISLTDFFSCRAVLGLSANLWSTAQLTALAAIAKNVCF